MGTAIPDQEPGPQENEVLIGLADDVGPSEMAPVVERETRSGATVVHSNETLNYLSLELPEAVDEQAVNAVASAFENNPGVEYVERNGTVRGMALSGAPNDPKFDEQWAPQKVNAPDAWETTLGSKDVTIAVLDTVVQADHPEIDDRYGDNIGKDFVDNDDDPTGTGHFHGTLTAGIATGKTDDGQGIAGISNSKLLSVRVLNDNFYGSKSQIADGIQYAADQGADIISMSLGDNNGSSTVQNAVNYAHDKGALLIGAAGNFGSNIEFYPAAHDNVRSTSATTRNDELWNQSNYGTWVDLCGPGHEVISSVPTDSYRTDSGTSFAAPITAGIAALALDYNPNLTNEQLWDYLQQSARDIGLPETEQGAGLVDAANMLDEVPPPETLEAVASADTTSVDPGETVTFDGSGSSDSDGTITSYEWDFGDGETASGVEVTHSYESDGEYTVTLTVTDDEGNTASDRLTVGVGINAPPDASISVSSSSVDIDESIEFDGSGSSDSDGSITSYEWDLGDGTTATGSTVTHSYGSAGEYTVTLTVTDDEGATDSVTTTVTVEDPLYCGTATNDEHKEAGRATETYGVYYAKGSGEYIGYSFSTTTLKETSEGYFETVDSC